MTYYKQNVIMNSHVITFELLVINKYFNKPYQLNLLIKIGTAINII